MAGNNHRSINSVIPLGSVLKVTLLENLRSNDRIFVQKLTVVFLWQICDNVKNCPYVMAEPCVPLGLAIVKAWVK